jgi:hypothetical protein
VILSLQRSDPGLGLVSWAAVMGVIILQHGVILCKSCAGVGVIIILQLGIIPGVHVILGTACVLT